jgi:protocatechuate 3,4-dioxygenase beta subunit
MAARSCPTTPPLSFFTGFCATLWRVIPPRFDRRRALAAFGTVSLGGLLAACGGDDETPSSVTTTEGETSTVQPKSTASPATAELFDDSASCRVTTELTEGPYYFDVDSIRSDITEDRKGTKLRLALRVRDAESCEPLENAVVDIWHCDATGNYSGFEAASQGGPPGGGAGPTDEKTYLRGAQVTNSEGIVQFKTIYPGWYRGRTVHIHAKVHLDKQTVLTSQLFTTREFDDKVFAAQPYAGDSGRDTFNDTDGIYEDGLELTLSEDGDGVLGVMTFDVARA